MVEQDVTYLRFPGRLADGRQHDRERDLPAAARHTRTHAVGARIRRRHPQRHAESALPRHPLLQQR